QRHGTSAERASEAFLIDLAYTHGIPLVATNEPFFAAREDYEAHDALICIAEGRLLTETDRCRLTPEHRFKTRAEMAQLFPDLPEALAHLLRAHHHRSRPDPLRPPVRALSQSGARVDARFRHRLLSGPARRSHRLCAPALRPRSGGADHHLWHAAGARRAARRRPRLADAVRAD